MKSFVSHLKLNQQILFAKILPLLALFFLLIFNILAEKAIYQSNTRVQRTYQMSQTLAQGMLVLQNERSATMALFSAAYADTQQKLASKRQKTDKALQILVDLDRNPLMRGLLPYMNNRIYFDESLMQRIEFIRMAVNKKDNSQYYQQYTEIITQLLYLFESKSMLTSNIDLNFYAIGLKKMLWLEEYAGREQALLSQLILIQTFDPALLASISTNIQRQDELIFTFLQAGGMEKHQHIFEQYMELDVFKNIEIIREQVKTAQRNKVAPQFNLPDLLTTDQQMTENGIWNILSSARVQQIHGFNQLMISHIIKESIVKKERSLLHIGIYLLLGLIVLAVSTLISIWITQRFETGVQQFSDTIDSYSKGGTFNEISIELGQDELSCLAQSFNQLIQLKNTLDQQLAIENNAKEKQAAKLAITYKELKESEGRIHSIINNAADGIIVMSDLGIVQDFNPAAEEMFGFSESEMIGQNIKILMPEPTQSEHDGYLTRYRKKGGIPFSGQRAEVTAQRKNGERFNLNLAVSEYEVDGEHIITGITSDISERKKLENELLSAKEKAETANKAKSEFLANMSHEIRTPMNGVIGMTDLLLDTPLNAEQHSFASTVKSSANSLLAIINDILDFSKVEAGMLKLELIDFNMRIVMQELGSTLVIYTYEKGIELICPANPMSHQWFNADSGRIRQILNNLIGNAIKFTDHGEIAVHYTIQKQTETHSKVRFEITDTGIGLNTEQQKRLFQRFSQADGSTTRQYGGTGLGLAISKQLVELMDGEIGVTSVEGQGSTFWFTLTLNKAASQGLQPVVTDLHEQKILVVNDNLTNCTLLEQLLSHWQAKYTLVNSAKAALESLKQGVADGDPYSIAILDMQLSEMNGAQLGVAIKKDNSLANTHLLVLTSKGLKNNEKLVNTGGFDAYINKPIDQSILGNTLLQITKIKTNTSQQHIVHKTCQLPQFKARVLVVEDAIINQMVAKGLLQKFGIQVDIAVNGEAALHALENSPENSPYDLIFMDCQMPVMDGFDATRHIRDPQSTQYNKTIVIVAMTANAMQGDREKCLAVGMNDFITKPVDMEKLQQTLQQWLPKSDVS